MGTEDRACCPRATGETFFANFRNRNLSASLIPQMPAESRDYSFDKAKLARTELRLALAQADELLKRAETVLSQSRLLGLDLGTKEP